MIRELGESFADLGDRKDVSVIVLSAAPGSRVFCAGVDLKEHRAKAPGSESAPSELLDPNRAWRETKAVFRSCPVPVVTAVEGAAIGIGFALVAWSDIVFASRQASFGLTEINVGVLGGSATALRLVGPSKARMMFFSGEMVPAEEFYRRGAIEELVDDGNAEDAALTFAAKLAQKSPIALRLAKESLLKIEFQDPLYGYGVEQLYTERLATFNDSREAMDAYLEKRDPQWTWT
jgi:enoyl-CoA hydratase